MYNTLTIIWQTSVGNIEGSKQNCTEWYPTHLWLVSRRAYPE